MANHQPIPSVVQRFNQLIQIYAQDKVVLIARFDQAILKWSNGDTVKYRMNEKVNNLSNTTSITIFPKRKIDRTCLMSVNHLPIGEYYNGQEEIHSLVDLINTKCQVFRSPNGNLNSIGMKRKWLLENLYSPNHHNATFSDQIIQSHHPLHSQTANKTKTSYRKCKVIDNTTTASEFIHSFLLKSQPVIIKGAIKHWPAITKWSNDYFKSKIGNKRIHIKLTEKGEFEGCESVANWKSKRANFKIPEAVRQQLQFDDLVVVRPATAELPFPEFLKFVTGENSTHQFSAYLEYTSIKDYMPQLVQDVQEISFVKDFLQLKHLNIWLSDGHTLGKLHFDPYDNFLCQLSGKKRLTLFDPHDNTRLYEGHIPEAMLEYDWDKKKFYRQNLLESTSMVMSPVDILKPNLQRFPKFTKAVPYVCEISPGDALFMPAFWWHEVQSFPDKKEKRNLAVNFWYEPFFTREFPCPTSKAYFKDLI
ncbi:uncharacterized protein TRIADDRAFT_58435 [Trichoplax adhaerens]|uniref:JmjC domain-containing protein n=1 Tax=Trichoplax adhaerens TaxID=10228 RepID=B3S2A6_TRIAD|nr:hypothetical protein TRIADDRAFT_58435 [Trichoplax adhaerens]EDV23297.1 hypothetical protein TRIADDRAFT_58435 [Trichoplax adhaerens]|eukprot:XP_002114207.1 hypothetical protein TRIADDRAFT_58435 [Trichoplax adhaerens]